MSQKTQLPAVAQEWHDDFMFAASRFFEEDQDGFVAFCLWFKSYAFGRYENDAEIVHWYENGSPFCGPAGFYPWLRSEKGKS